MLVDRVRDDERMALVQRVFDRLAPEQQWAVIERVFGEDVVREHLGAAVLATDAVDALQRRARASGAIDTREVPAGERLTLGLFRASEARAALGRGQRSSTCARRLVLRAEGDGSFRVLEDVFNPNGGYFVTAEYSEDTWRAHEQLAGHTRVRVGALSDAAGALTFEPVVFAGGRVDVEVDGRATEGRLHLGFAILRDRDVFVPEG